MKNADAKITALAAVVGVSASLLGTRSGDAARVLRLGPGLGHDLTVVTIGFLVLFFSATVIFIGMALFPRTAESENRFAWPSVAKRFSPPRPDPAHGIDDAWAQAHQLAKIAQAKYRYFRLALLMFCFVIVDAAVGLTVVSWVVAGLPPV
ncbi:hypothetical protein [Leifsonia shinshuensis]|uniref:hypothetical protein n=1 Tax=Leifsonia shinshuensis TaxID=150026 RepID=UPI002857C64F|nr:hypothetical protein [Leifsonia shinshuensis]MDR6972037.1 hypothetical protein [Leifsonia shinshuensis]